MTAGSGDWAWIAGLAIVAGLAGSLILVGWIADRGRASGDPHADWDDLDLDPVGVLRMRYAYGEIDRDEFIVAKQTLESADQSMDRALSVSAGGSADGPDQTAATHDAAIGKVFKQITDS